MNYQANIKFTDAQYAFLEKTVAVSGNTIAAEVRAAVQQRMEREKKRSVR